MHGPRFGVGQGLSPASQAEERNCLERTWEFQPADERVLRCPSLPFRGPYFTKRYTSYVGLPQLSEITLTMSLR